MAKRYQTITELYRNAQISISSSRAWQDFLSSACRNYRLSFDEQLLVYAQRPDATAVLEIERWNRNFGRWVNRGAAGIAVFDEKRAGRVRLKYYFDISDTHEGNYSRRVPIWSVEQDQETEIIEALENSFGELDKKEDLSNSLISAAKNAVEDHVSDYYRELISCKEDSFLEEMDVPYLEAMYRTILKNSIGYMLLSRCGLDPSRYYTDDDFRSVSDFNTPYTINALGIAVSDISQMCLSVISKTVMNRQRQTEKGDRTFAEDSNSSYSMTKPENDYSERRNQENEYDHIHDDRGLQPSRSSAAPGAPGSPWEIRIDAKGLSEETPQSSVYESSDVRKTEWTSEGDREDSSGENRGVHKKDVRESGTDGGDESQGSHEMGGTDEQYPSGSRGEHSSRTDLQLETEHKQEEKTEIPAFLDEKLIMAVIENREDDLKVKKEQIESFFSTHTGIEERTQYLHSVYQDRFTEIIVDDIRIGYRPQEDGLLMWEGAYLSRKSESVFSWEMVTELTAGLIEKKEYCINTGIVPPETYDAQQMTLFEMKDFDIPVIENGAQFSLDLRMPLSQQVIDEALCIGANDKNSRKIICAYLMKDKTTEDNADFLKQHYGTNGAGFYLDEQPYSIWYDERGMRIARGNRASVSSATELSWKDAARRIRELLDLGRYMPQSEIDVSVEYELRSLARDIAFLVRDFSEEAKRAGYVSAIGQILSSNSGFPETEEQIIALLKEKDRLEQLIHEWEVFNNAFRENHSLVRFRYYRPEELLQKLRDLQREPIVFMAANDAVTERKLFITADEIDRVLRGGEGRSDYRLDVYSFFSLNSDNQARESFLKKYHGEYSGYHGGNDSRIYSGKGLYFSHGTITAPYAKVEICWKKVTKRITEMISEGIFLSEKDRELMPEYEIRQLAKEIYRYFYDAPEGMPRPYTKDEFSDYWEGVKGVEVQLYDHARTDEIYQTMMLSLWEQTLPEDRYYENRKKGLAAMEAYRAGTYSVFGREKTLLTLSERIDPETKKLIDEYCQEEFGQGADYSDPRHVALAFSSTADSEYSVEISADLISYRLLYQVDGEMVQELCCDTLAEFHEYLANLDFDVMVAQADEWYQEKQAIRKTEIASEQERVISDVEPSEISEPIILPKQKHSTREYVEFKTLCPEIPREQRWDYRITDEKLGQGTPGEKYIANIQAIRCLKQIEAEGRLATPEEQEILSRYVGWGGLSDYFDERHARYSELKALLSEEEYNSARASVLTAFYTPPIIIHAMYEALVRMGVQQGNILEPACGIGNFIGMMPEELRTCKVYGVELDSISGRIAGQLYQNSSIAVNGYEKVQMPDSFFDVAVGNVPFGDFKVLDKRYDKHHFQIHDYFFGKTLDKVRPGGIVAFITSKGTMDKENPSVRKYLAQRAELIGAIRLPDTAFKRNAGTEVTADILFLQKRDRLIDIEPDWVYLDTDENGIKINRYFVAHPEMILGNMVMESTQFGMGSACKEIEGEDLGLQLRKAIQNLHAQITEYETEDLDEEDLSIPASPDVKNFSFTIVDGQVYFRENSRMYPAEVSVTAENRIRGMIELRECVRRLIDLQSDDYPDKEIIREQERLNKLYDEYTEKYGLLSSRGNSLAFRDDSSYYLLCSLEILDEEGNFKRKADMFSKRTIRPHEPVTSVDTASEALAISIAEKARVDMEYMSELSGKTADELERELIGIIFRNIQCAENPGDISDPSQDMDRYPLVTADEYLSGNVRKKLRMAKAMYEALLPEKKEQIRKNVEALEAVQPKDLTAGEIGVRVGVNWIPTEVYEAFMYELFATTSYARNRIRILRSHATGEWNITNKSYDNGNVPVFTTYGTKRINAYHILEQTLNQKEVRVFDTLIDAQGNEKRVLNKKETAIAQDRQELIKSKFSEWIWQDIDRREILCKIYNETFNSIRPREYDGKHIRFYGMNPEIHLRPHQVNAIAHIMYGGNTLLAHEVGAGKTFEMVAAAMESKRLGLCTKSLVVVPNHITEQWAAEWLQLYPSANILVATKKDFETRNRKKFCARIATGDYDAVIIGHSQFEKIAMSKERQEVIIQRQIDDVMDGIREAKRARAEQYTIKQLERTKKSLENRLARLNDQSRKDDVVTFEQLGVDRLFVDESHFYKNLFLATKMRNVGGIAQTDAQKSSDLFMKCQYLNEITGGRGVIFATGTPISNSMVELYTIQRYLQYDTLEEMDMIHFDDWAAAYGETVTAIELSPEGSGYRSKTRFAKFYNLPELMSTFKMVADIQTADMLNLPVPKANFHTEVIHPSELQQEMIQGLADRAEAIRAGSIDPTVDNMLTITNDGRKLALDMRLLQPLAPDNEDGKVSVCARNICRIWEQTKENRSTQMVFCDLSTPKNDGTFNVYDDLKKKLMEKGIPEEEIAYIHSANTEAKKKELFAKVRSGQVRILIGSTQKMGAGTNCQDRLIALHDLDCPWRPSDLAQRLGRIVRQGNQNPEVEIFRYVTENTFDAYLYQLVENKQKFIGQIMTSKSPARVAEDVDETALSYSEIKALATGNPLIIEKCNLEMEVAKLYMLKANHLNQKYALEELALRKYPETITALSGKISGMENDIKIAASHPKPKEGFIGMEINGQQYTEKEGAGKAILAACAAMTGSDTVFLGQYRGFSISMFYEKFQNKYHLLLKGSLSHAVVLGADVLGNITRIDNVMEGFPETLERMKNELEETKVQLKNAQKEMNAPFTRAEELEEKAARLKELDILLNMDQKDTTLFDEPYEGELSDGGDYRKFPDYER